MSAIELHPAEWVALIGCHCPIAIEYDQDNAPGIGAANALVIAGTLEAHPDLQGTCDVCGEPPHVCRVDFYGDPDSDEPTDTWLNGDCPHVGLV
jgi:hypothetical protein